MISFNTPTQRITIEKSENGRKARKKREKNSFKFFVSEVLKKLLTFSKSYGKITTGQGKSEKTPPKAFPWFFHPYGGVLKWPKRSVLKTERSLTATRGFNSLHLRQRQAAAPDYRSVQRYAKPHTARAKSEFISFPRKKLGLSLYFT